MARLGLRRTRYFQPVRAHTYALPCTTTVEVCVSVFLGSLQASLRCYFDSTAPGMVGESRAHGMSQVERYAASEPPINRSPSTSSSLCPGRLLLDY